MLALIISIINILLEEYKNKSVEYILTYENHRTRSCHHLVASRENLCSH